MRRRGGSAILCAGVPFIWKWMLHRTWIAGVCCKLGWRRRREGCSGEEKIERDC